MNTRAAIRLWLICVCTWASWARAELIVYEPFDYAAGDVDGQNGGTGFDGPWIGDAIYLDQIQIVQPDDPLSYTVPGGGTIQGGDRALRLLNDTPDVILDVQQMLQRDFSGAVEGDDVYISFLYRYAGGEINDNDFVVWWFNQRAEPTPNIGLKGNRGDGSGPEDLMARLDNNVLKADWAPDDISEDEGTIGQDFLLVGHLYRGGASDDPADYDQFDLWVNPTMDEQDSPHASAMAEPDDFLATELLAIGMRAYNQEPDDEMLWDELRIGTTWADVVNPLGLPALRAGDADQDYDFDQLDLVRVQIASKYLTGQSATWGEGDWNGAPGGTQGAPPAGDGQFNQLDIIAALGADIYLSGPYAAARSAGADSLAHVARVDLFQDAGLDDLAEVGTLAADVWLGDTGMAYIPVPEPAGLALLTAGLAMVARRIRR